MLCDDSSSQLILDTVDTQRVFVVACWRLAAACAYESARDDIHAMQVLSLTLISSIVRIKRTTVLPKIFVLHLTYSILFAFEVNLVCCVP